MEFPGYELGEFVFKSSKTCFFKAIRKMDRKPVLVKTINSPFPTVIDRANYKYEHDILKTMKHPALFQPLGLEMDRQCFALVLEPFAGAPTNPETFMTEVGMAGFLEMAIKVADFLVECHSRKIVHRNLKPHNILFSATTGEIKIIGFLLTSLRDDHLSEDRLQEFIGALHYISPEQTGRLHHNVDSRSDLYSLGVTLYHLVTGRLPFSAEDPMALVHCHIAMMPEAPHQRDPAIPSMLSRIIMKLLEKSPEDRYQSALGLAEDLRRMLTFFREGKPDHEFQIGLRDVIWEFKIPNRLYGRNEELEILENALVGACCGERRLVSILGESGMGKSELVNEIRGPISTAHGYFISGKYERDKQNIPYLGLLAAFEVLARHILAESRAQVNRWREELNRALQGNGQVLVDVVPDLEMVIGQQQPVPVLGTAETRNRFELAMKSFVAVVATKEHPLTLFLDDMHWADEASCQLLSMLLQETSISHLLVITAYPIESALPGTALAQIVRKQRESGGNCDTITLNPLKTKDVQAMLRDLIGVPPEQTLELAQLVVDRTGGRLFDIGIFLKSLHDDGLLAQDPKTGQWSWDLARIGGETSSRNASDVIIERFRRLPDATRDLIRVAACLGNRFSLRMLAIGCQKSQRETAAGLKAAIEDELIQPQGDSFRLLEVYGAEDLKALKNPLDIFFQFRHNQVQQVIYSLMDLDQSMETHLNVGRRLAESARGLKSDIFRVVNQLNLGRHLIKSPQERQGLARMELRAAKKAMAAMAWGTAREYLCIGLELRPNRPSEKEFDLWMDLNMSLAEVEGCDNKLESAHQIQEKILEHARGINDKARVYMQRLVLLHNAGKLAQAVQAGLKGLALYGQKIPEDKPRKLKTLVEGEMAFIHRWMEEQGHRAILDLPSAPEKNREYFQLLMLLTPVAFNTNQMLFRLITLLQLHSTLQEGLTSDSPYAIAVYGIILGTEGRYFDGQEMAQLAAELEERQPDPGLRYKLDFIGCNLINHFTRHLKDDLSILNRVYFNALRYGDLVWANYAILVDQQHRWVLDLPLLDILNEGEQYVKFSEQTSNTAVLACLRYINSAILNLRGLTHSSQTLDSDDFDSETCVKLLESTNYLTGLSVYYIINMQVLYLRGHYSKAYEMAQLSQNLIGYSANTLMMTVHYFFYALTLTVLYETVDNRTRTRYRKIIQECCRKLEIWAEHCPENFKHRYLLVKAELARISGQDYAAMQLYQDCIRCATDEELPMVEGVAHELLARFYRARGFANYVEFHIRAAIHCFEEWGAIARVADLQEKYCAYLENSHLSRRYGLDKVSEREAAYSRAFDMTTLMKTSQAISGEFRLDQLLTKLVELVLENAGAQRGAILLMRDGEPLVEVACDVSDPGARLLGSLTMDEYPHVARGVVRYVLRTKAPLVVSDVSRSPQYRVDRYMKTNRVKALMCLPIMRQTEIIGILYLENLLAPGAFSADRVEILRLLAPQIAISLENARFISQMTALNSSLEAEIVERKKAEEAMRKAQKIAVANARNAAKVDFASSVLHNINNVLNSVGLSCEMVVNTLRDTKMEQLARLVALINANKENPAAFFTHNPKGQMVPKYLIQLANVLGEEHRVVADEMKDLSKNLGLMRSIIEQQQADAKGVLHAQATDLGALVEDALKIHADPLTRNRIEVARHFVTDTPIKAGKIALTHILINLIKNAIEAMATASERKLTLIIHKPEPDYVYLTIRDTGVGIPKKQMEDMFTHGFTTKKDGHGFGLHYCARAIREMGGSIEVTSEGRGKGASFHLKFQVAE